ncbi:MAG TPA: hypothetical protein VK935_02625 [Actinomycetospora sp.]|nr:hypothetical protein [Actinomycetospora sp.]
MGLNRPSRRRLGPLPVSRDVSRSERGSTTSWTVTFFGTSRNGCQGTRTVDLPGNWSSTAG